MSNPKRRKPKKRRGSKESLISIDPYTLGLIKKSARNRHHVNKTDMNLSNKINRHFNNSNQYGSHNNVYNHNNNNYEENIEQKSNEQKEKEKLIQEQQITISKEELEDMFQEAAQMIREKEKDAQDLRDSIDRMVKEHEAVQMEYVNEINNLTSQKQDLEEKIMDLSNGDNDIQNYSDRLKEKFEDDLNFVKDNHKKEIAQIEKKMIHLNKDLKKQYDIANGLRKSLELSQDETNVLYKQVNDLNKKLMNYKLLKRENNQLDMENEKLKGIVAELSNQLDQWAQEEYNQGPGSKSQLYENMDELGMNDMAQNSVNKRDSVEMKPELNGSKISDNIQRINSNHSRHNSMDSIGKHSMSSKIENTLADQLIFPKSDEIIYDDDQKTAEAKETEDNESDKSSQINNNNNNNNNNKKKAPTSWKEVLNSINQKTKPSSKNASVISQYEDSETNMEEKIDNIEEDVLRIKELVEQILDETQNIVPEMNNQWGPLKRQISRIALHLTGNDLSINESKTNEIDDSSEQADVPKTEIKKEKNNKWYSWLIGNDLGSSQINKEKKSFLEEWAPSIGFSIVILSVLYILRGYKNGHITFGQPRVLRNTTKLVNKTF